MRINSRLNPVFFEKSLDIKGDSIKGGAWSFAMQVVNFLVQIIGTIILARLLFPEDFGLMAMVGTFMNFLAVFKNFGLTTSIIQIEKLDNNLFNSIFLINVFIGAILTILFIAISPFISWFYDSEKLLWISIIYSFTFILDSLSSPFLALLKRSMKFNIIFKVQIFSRITGTLSGVIFALLGFGYWSLIMAPLFSSFFILLFIFSFFKWYPSRFLYSKKIKEVLHFGKHLTIFNIINYFSRNVDNILIGKYFGSYNLGLYNKSYSLLLLPINQVRNPLMNVALPALSSLRNNPNEFKNYYLKFVSILTVITTIISLLFIINSKEFILVVLGNKWAGAIEVFHILSFAALVQPIYGTFGLLLISLGQPKKYSIWGFYNALIIILSFLIGIQYNIKTFAILYVIANFITFFFSSFYVLKNTPIKLSDFFKTTIPKIIIFIFVALIVDKFILIEDMYIQLIIKSLLFTILSLFIIFFFFKEGDYLLRLIKTKLYVK